VTAVKPVVYLLRGDDSTRVNELLVRFKTELGSADMAGLNTSVLDGASTSLDEIRSAAFAMPFLTERRLVIVYDVLAKLDGKKGEAQKKFLELLDGLPHTTALVLVIEDKQVSKRGQTYWEKLGDTHWLMKWVKSAGTHVWVEDCPLPSEREMTGWIHRKARELGGNFITDAAARLAEYIGNDTRRAMQEINKLLTYTGGDRPVTSNEVVLLTAQEQEGNIFDMTDALGERNGLKALEQLHILLETNDVLELSGMINRQFRLLLQAREILDERKGEDQIREELNLHPYVAKKLTEQARHFSIEQLETIYRKLLKIDIDIKSGGMPGDVAFEVLIAEMTA